jgi:hypothetical protein
VPIVLPVGLVFLVNSFLLGSFLSRIPDLQAQMGIDKAELGLTLFAAPLGTLLCLPFAGPLVGRITARRASIIAVLSQCAVVPLIGLVGGPLTFALALFAFGALNALAEVGMNAQAELVEMRTGGHIISRCHGFWSLGIALGGVGTAACGHFGVGVAPQLFSVAAVALLAILWLSQVLPHLQPDTRASGASGPFALPSRAALGACVMVLGVTLVEGSMLDWSTLYLRTVLEATRFEEGVGYATFAFTMALARFSGDFARARVSGPAIVLGSAALTALGLLGLILAPNVVAGWAALGVIGIGVAVVYPVAIAAVAGAGGASPATNVAGLTLIVMVTMLLAPPVIGIVAETTGLTYAFMGILPLVAITVVFSGHARRRATGEFGDPPGLGGGGMPRE